MALNPRQQLFVDAYLKHFNATKAAKEAGYSDRTAYSQGHDLLKKPEIRAALQKRYTENAMDSDELLHHLAEIARGNIDDVIDDKGNLDLARARELGKSPLIKSVRSKTTLYTDKNGDGGETFETEIGMYDRMKAIELIMRHLSLFNDKVIVQDWRSELIALVKQGKLALADVQMELGDELAQDLFIRESVPSLPSGEG